MVPVRKITAGVPVHEIAAMAEMETTLKGPSIPEHVANVSKIALIDPEVSVSEDVANFFHEWVAEQQEQQQRATQLIERLDHLHPPPSTADLINGNPEWPEWFAKWWGFALRLPWGGALKTACDEAEAWIDAQS